MKRILSSFTRGVLILGILGAMMLWLSAGDFFVSLKPAQSFEDLMETNAKKGAHIKGNVVYSYDCFASEETWKEGNGTRTPAKTSSYFYAIPSADNILALKVNTNLSASMEKLASETFDVLTGAADKTTTQVAVEGCVNVMEKDLTKLFTEYLLEIGYTQAEIDAMGTPLVIEQRAFNSIRGIFAVGIILLILAVVFYIRNFKRNAPVKSSVEGGQTYTA